MKKYTKPNAVKTEFDKFDLFDDKDDKLEFDS